MASAIIQVTSIILTIGSLFFMVKGLNRPLSMACYAVAMLPFQISCPFFPALKVNELAIILWLVVFIFFLIRKKKLLLSRYVSNIFIVILLVSLFNLFKYFQTGNSGVITELIRLLVSVFFPLTVSLSFFDKLVGRF